MLDKLLSLENRFTEMNKELSDPNVIADLDRYQKLAKEHKALEPIIEKIIKYKSISKQLEEDKKVIEENSDPELVELAQMEVDELEENIQSLEDELKILLVPKVPEDEKNCIMEIRAGTGGDEAGIFAGDLYRMYLRYCERNKYKVDVMNTSEATRGGYKEVIFSITGSDVYGQLKYESGVHRVQRVPETEAQGRVHTSAASVAVLPEVEDVEIALDPSELKVDVYRSSGPGGQSVNTTDSAVRITHIPSGIVVTCQDEKSQHKNKAKALKVLKARIYDIALQEQHKEIDAQRRTMVGSGDRSAKIRTYNYPQGRVTDHRINFTVYKLDSVMQGEIEEFIEKMQMADQEARLEMETGRN